MSMERIEDVSIITKTKRVITTIPVILKDLDYKSSEQDLGKFGVVLGKEVG